jgi:hypothetical protein
MKQTTDPNDWRTPPVEQLADALVSIDDREAMLAFLRDICSFNELSTLAQRLEVARLVDAGIAQWVRHGQGGYRAVLDGEQGRA